MKKIISLLVVVVFILGVFTLGCGRPNDADRAWYDAKLTKQEGEDRLARAKDMANAYGNEYDAAVAKIGELETMHAGLHAQRNAAEKAKGQTITPLYHGETAPPSYE
jgi:hypothetical protein